jgi:hypothetical protein
VSGARKALVVATYSYADVGLRRLAAPEHDAESFASVLKDPAIAGFDVTMLVNQPHYVVGEAIADFYTGSRNDDLTLLYFTGHGLKDDEGRLYLAMTNTRREALMFTAISGAQLNDAMDASRSRRKVLILDCCYSGAFPAGRTAKADEGVQTLERFQGKGRAVLTASDATQYAFEGDDLRGSGTSSVFTRYLVEAISSGAADLDEDGDIALDELYSYVYERVVAEMPQQRPKKQEDVDGRILIARNVHWTLPVHLQHAVESPISAQRLSAVEELGHLHRAGNEVVRAAVTGQLTVLAADDSRSVSSAATALLERVRVDGGAQSSVRPPPAGPAPPPPRQPADGAAAVVKGLRAPDRLSPGGPAEAATVSARAVMGAPAAPAPSTVVAGVTERPGGADPAPPRDVAAPPARTGTGRGAPVLVLALVVLSSLPLTLSRLLSFESSTPYTADGFSESTLPWTVLVVLPLVVAAGLLAVRAHLPRLQPVALGLVLGAGLLLVETAAFWFFFFYDNRASYVVGPALWSLGVGAVLVAAAGVVVLTRSSVAGRAPARIDWRALCAVVVVAAAFITIASGQETSTGAAWLASHEGTLLLAAAALPLTLLRLRGDQRTAGLVALTLFGLWSVYFPVRELVAPMLGLEPSVWVVEIACVVVTVVACCVAQVDLPRRRAGPAAH